MVLLGWNDFDVVAQPAETATAAVGRDAGVDKAEEASGAVDEGCLLPA